MNENLTLPLTREAFLKALDLIHLTDEQRRLFDQRKLNKETMAWAVKHLSECYECCAAVSELTAPEIEDALSDTDYGRPDLIEQTVKYYFETLEEIQ